MLPKWIIHVACSNTSHLLHHWVAECVLMVTPVCSFYSCKTGNTGIYLCFSLKADGKKMSFAWKLWQLPKSAICAHLCLNLQLVLELVSIAFSACFSASSKRTGLDESARKWDTPLTKEKANKAQNKKSANRRESAFWSKKKMIKECKHSLHYPARLNSVKAPKVWSVRETIPKRTYPLPTLSDSSKAILSKSLLKLCSVRCCALLIVVLLTSCSLVVPFWDLVLFSKVLLFQEGLC